MRPRRKKRGNCRFSQCEVGREGGREGGRSEEEGRMMTNHQRERGEGGREGGKGEEEKDLL